MATLIDAAEFTSNEVYQIQATDPVEGAASGASFSGPASRISRISSWPIAPRS
jgi:hypothetical protein